ncbi:cytochrome c3 family protein [Geomonas sp. Red32]|uniref:cytochrome c3 family protein n=1 Tax=Geomonas sp. Red32 TaxID=2912856 RepID=UPI00202CF66B|nr:cytochrome c3 family protein [Geomonas sp. Red32]MCM0079991.1 cytochrome c3 family protein [Geomonas sp. Red32]
MKNVAKAAAALILVLAATSALAVPPGKTVEWQTPNGKVVFSGDVHAKKGLKCADCHTKIFKMKKGADVFKMSDIYAGKYCGVCHNGKKAFKAMGNCAKCHKK